MNKYWQVKIQEVSFQMFRDWTANAQIQYPDYDFTIINETILVEDLEKAIRSAVNSLKKEDKISKRKIEGFDIGFIWGFIYANLNTHWFYEYISKKSNEYKVLMTLKSLQLYLQLEEIALIKIDEIYKNMLTKEANFEYTYFKPNKKNFSDFSPNLKIDTTINTENNILIALDSLIIERIVKIIENDVIYFLPEIKNYFSENDVNIFIYKF